MEVVIVESPAKSRTINQYLGKNYTVLASYGHIRDLPSKDGSVRPEDDFAMTYQLDKDKESRLKDIVKAMKGADGLILATDPDREGEAISWHVLEALKEKKAIKDTTPVKRVVFNEITKKAVLDGIANAREIDMDLVNAQQARRALDYLVGFTLSPVLWRKLPGSRSAGRVQSVALRLICERENEIEQFNSEEYWTIAAQFKTSKGDMFEARLARYAGDKIEKFSFRSEAEAQAAVKALEALNYTVGKLTPKTVRRNPAPPFTTSTLQQEAARKLGFGAKKTMQVAQKLYEGIRLDGGTTGLITYMRTDGTFVSNEAIAECRSVIASQFGSNYVPDKPRHYTKKAKNAQEAHEAIRPTSLARTPDAVKGALDTDQFKLYSLIWKRMMASQMESAVMDQLSVDLPSNDNTAGFRATGSQIKFPGFLALYREGVDDKDDDDSDRLLPDMKEGEDIRAKEIAGEQHFTEPPPRYSEASLVKKLEELGIGRPSTYAAILSVLQDREYVKLEKRRFFPEPRGRIVTAFLESFFKRYVEYDYTASLEDSLDDISAGKIDWKVVLRMFWEAFKPQVDATMELPPAEILGAVERLLAFHIFPDDGSGKSLEARKVCPQCNEGELNLKAGKFGAFLGCSNYPECNYTRPLDAQGGAAGDGAEQSNLPRLLGEEDGRAVQLKKGPYGLYIEQDIGEEKPKRVSLPKGINPDSLTLPQALQYLQLPRTIGTHPEIGKPITAGIGRYGPYVECNRQYVSLPADENVLDIGMNRAVDLIAEKAKKAGASATPLRVLGDHPDGGEVAVYSGRYGPYVKHGKLNASLRKGMEPDTLSMDEAVELLAAKAKAPKKKAPAKGKAKKAPAKKKAS